MPFTAVLKELQRSSMATTASSSATTIASSTSTATGTNTSTSTATTATATSTISTSNLPTNCTPVTTNNQHSSASCTVNTANNCSNKVNHHQISPCTSTSLDQTSCKSMTVSNGDLHHKITGNSSHAHLFHHPPDVHPHHLHHSLLTGGGGSSSASSSSCLPGTLVVASSTGTSVVPSVVPVAINLQLTPSDLLRSAATAGDFEQVKELCKQSVTIDADAEGRTALHYAAVNGHLQIVKEIINAGAKVNVKDAVSSHPDLLLQLKAVCNIFPNININTHTSCTFM